MKIRDFKIGWRLLTKDPGYSSVVLLGLSIGFAVCFLLLDYVRYSFSFDMAVPHAERIYMAEMRANFPGEKWLEGTALPFLDVGQRSGLVESSTVLEPIFTAMKVGTRVTKDVQLFAVHPDFTAMFAIQPLAGDLQAALTRPDMLALTESQANILFGNKHVVGKSLEIAGKTYVVAALLPDPPSNSSISYAALTGINSAAWSEERRQEEYESWGSTEGGRLFFKLKPGVAPAALTQILQDASAHSPVHSQLPPDLIKTLAGKPLLDMKLVNLTDLYFDNNTANTTGRPQHGERKIVLGLSLVAGLILLLAVANYVNLATVRTLGRQREIAVRKVLGASAARVSRQFFTESLLVTLIASALGLLLAELVLPVFADLMERKLDSLITLTNLAAILLIGSVVGLAAGAYPTWVALRVLPQLTLTGRGASETIGAQNLRRLLTVLQFSTAMALTGITLAIGWQTYFASHIYPGFDPKPLLVITPLGDINNPAVRSLRESLQRIPGVTGITGALNLLPGRSYDNNATPIFRSSGEKAEMPVAKVNANYFDVLGLPALAGRLFEQSNDNNEKANVTILSAKAAHDLGYPTPEAALGQIVTVGSGAAALALRVVGVTPDIRYVTLRNQARPILYIPDLKANNLMVRTSGDMRELERQVNALQAQHFPNDSISVRRMESYFSESYAEDLRLAKLLGLASMIAIAIAAFGIYVLSAYNVQRLTRQIVLRKLFGASRIAIGKLVGREFMLVIAIGGLIGLPIAAWSIQRYLANFVEHAPIGAWTLLAATVIALLVTVISTLRHTNIAMQISPSLALRD